jgi:uncharacterized protein YrrD
MQRNINSMIGFNLGTIDGEIGKVKDLYLDDNAWIIRYLIVKTGSWLFGREVLISPEAVMKNSWKQETFPVSLTKEQIRTSPDIDTDKPVSRQQEIELYGHYPWQPYWGSGFYAGGLWDAPNPSSVIDEKIINSPDDEGRIADENHHLRSTKEVTGYNIHATDGEIGNIKDFIIDDQSWRLLYMVVNLHNWLGGKKVLIDVHHIKEVQWHKSKIVIDMTVDAIKDCTIYQESKFIEPVQSIHQ